MSETLIQNGGAFISGRAQTRTAGKAEPPALDALQTDAPPVGYRWVSKRWRVLPDGTRDYAAFHGKTAFSSLLPVSSRQHTPKR